MRLALRNRPDRERRVLSLLRGAALDMVPRSRRDGEAVPRAEHLRCFAHLRRVAGEHGLAIQPPGLPYVGNDELRLLSWLAEAQRVTGFATMPRQPELRAALLRCAGLLDGMGMRLAPLTLYGARLRMLTG
ncbi:hypothetical protein RN629_16595 [Sphingomonadaceae bacterium jetA1]|uniref:hypothetical protein n=1 Tax=Facivitalis istanbulensis TaxID=3075838 RepID=UPI00348F588F